MQGEQSGRGSLHVGVGAGAGSSTALADFFAGLHVDTGAIHVVVLAGPPDGWRASVDALRRVTDWPVITARDGMRCEPGSIHVVPPDAAARLVDGRLTLSTGTTAAGVGPTDALLHSLADAAGAHTVAVLLSGHGTDGAAGARAVKAAGGFVLVQAPDDAIVRDVPCAAPAIGIADFVLAAPLLARQLERYAAHPLVAGTPAGVLGGSAGVDDRSLRRLFALLLERGRVDFAHYKPSTVAACIERRMRARDASDLDAYRALLESMPDEARTLERDLLGNRTRFFRDPEAFARLQRDVIVPLVSADTGHAELRVWIVGCSTGQEAYSLAVLLHEAQASVGRRRRVKVFATDVDAEAIATAAHGRYPPDIRTDVSEERLRRHFTRVDDSFVLRTHIRQMVVFATHDVVTDTPFSHVDLLCCRNVLVHFRQDVQQKVLAGFHHALRPRGWLFLGPDEGLGELGPHFAALDERRGLFRQASADRVPMSTSRSAPGTEEAPARDGASALPPVAGLLRHYRSAPRDEGFEHVRQTLLDERLPPCLVLDENYRIVQAFGDAGRYLSRHPRTGASRDVRGLLVPELSTALESALEKARRADPSEGRARIEVAGGTVAAPEGRDAAMTIDLEVEHHAARHGRPPWFAVLFHERNAERTGAPSSASTAANDAEAQRRIASLEAELSHARVRLRAAHTRLHAMTDDADR